MKGYEIFKLVLTLIFFAFFVGLIIISINLNANDFAFFSKIAGYLKYTAISMFVLFLAGLTFYFVDIQSLLIKVRKLEKEKTELKAKLYDQDHPQETE